MKHIGAILWKQMKDTLKNKTILIQFLLFPIMTIIMENAIEIENMPEHFFAVLFAVMFIGMAPLTSMSAIISEEKEKNTLRVLLMSNVKPMEYLFGVGVYVWSMCMIGAVIIACAGGYKGKSLLYFILIMAVGILVSMLIGAVIGTMSKSQMMATSVTIPVMMIFSFVPMLAMFNDSIEKIGKITYTQQLSVLLSMVEKMQLEIEQPLVIGVTIFITLILFIVAYKKSGLE